MELLLKRCLAFGRSYRQQIFQRRADAARNLRRSCSGKTYLIEGEMDVILPRHHSCHEAHRALIVAMYSLRKCTGYELTQAIV